MADILKYGNAIRLAQLASDPANPENGVIYYNTTSNVIRQYVNGGFQDVPDQALTLVGLALTDGHLIIGNGSNLSASVDSAAVGDIDADATNGLTIKADVIVNADINAAAAIELSKLAALTANRALASNASGVISASSVTDTELGYLSGVTSAVQTQLNAKANDADVIKKDGSVDFTGNQSMGGFKLTDVGAPTAAGDAANKSYVDGVASGLDLKSSVRLATAAALPAYTASGSGVGKTLTADANGALSVDGVAVALSNRILVKDEGAPHIDHGIYVVSQVGDGSNPWILTRSTDFDQDSEISNGAFTFVREGTVNADSGWVLITDDPITIDTTALAFTQFSGAGQIDAGDGLSKTGNTLSVNVDGQGIELVADQLALELDGATLTKSASGLKLSDTAVTPGSFGSASETVTITIDQQGRLTAASEQSISITASQVSDFNEAAQDAVGGILTNSAKIDLTYDDGANTISADIVAGSLFDVDINANAAIDASKIADGSVSNAEFQYLANVTSDIQTQFSNKANTSLNNLVSTAINVDLIGDSANGRSLGSGSIPYNFVHATNFRTGELANVSFTGDTTSGSAVITNIPDTSILSLSMVVHGSGIPAGAFINSIDSATQITLAANATATATGVSLTGAYSMVARTGNKSLSEHSGDVILRSGNTANGNSGNVVVRSGSVSGSGTRGSLNLQGNNINLSGSGDVFTSLDVIPTSNNSLDLGSSSNKFRDLYLGSGLILEDPGAGSNTVELQAADGSDAYTLTLPSSLPGSTQAVTLSASGQLATSAFAAASAGDINETSFTGLANNTADQVITGFAFNNAVVRSFKAQVSVIVDAAADSFAVYELQGIQRGADWQMSELFTGDSITGLTFNITSAGQVRVTIGNIAGFVSGTIKFRALTTSV